MLRVGLTGDLGSGKSTVAAMLAALGAQVFSSDEIARTMMQPGEPVYAAIVAHFPPSVVDADGTLDRRELARIAFSEGRVEELNSIVHPPVIAEQARRIDALERAQPHAIAVVESALIFTTRHSGAAGGWLERFDCIVLVTAPLEAKLQRFVQRTRGNRALTDAEAAELAADARRRLAAQAYSAEQTADCLVIANDGTVEDLRREVNLCWLELQRREQAKG